MISPLLLVLGAGIGVFNNFQTEYSQVKQFEIGVERQHTIFNSRFAIGEWFDDSHYPGARNSWYCSYRWGVGPRMGHYDVSFYLGPTFIVSPDTVLSSNLQFNPGLEWVLKDTRNVHLGLYFDHFSNAGFVKPNIGRNFLGVRLKL